MSFVLSLIRFRFFLQVCIYIQSNEIKNVQIEHHHRNLSVQPNENFKINRPLLESVKIALDVSNSESYFIG